MSKIILNLALFVGIVTYLFWNHINEKYQIPVFYIGNAMFILMLSFVIYLQNRKLFISFFLLCIAANNLLDELFFSPKKVGLNEIIITLIIPILYYARQNHARKFRVFCKNIISCIFGRRCKNSHRDEKK